MSAALRISELVNELGISTQKLVMPTRSNLEEFDVLLVAAGALVDMKRQVERVSQELRMLRAQKEGFVPPVEQRKVSHVPLKKTPASSLSRRDQNP
jgi:DNA methyltransferase 1-associated protein 1